MFLIKIVSGCSGGGHTSEVKPGGNICEQILPFTKKTYLVLFKINFFHKLLYLKSLFCSWRRIIEIGNRYIEGGFLEADEANERDEEASERIISSEPRLKRYVGIVINF